MVSVHCIPRRNPLQNSHQHGSVLPTSSASRDPSMTPVARSRSRAIFAAFAVRLCFYLPPWWLWVCVCCRGSRSMYFQGRYDKASGVQARPRRSSKAFHASHKRGRNRRLHSAGHAQPRCMYALGVTSDVWRASHHAPFFQRQQIVISRRGSSKCRVKRKMWVQTRANNEEETTQRRDTGE